MKSLTFHFNKNFIYVIIYWVLEISYHLATHLGETNFDLTNDEIKNEYFFVILLNIADLLSGFLVLYMKCSFKRANDAKKSLENKEQIANSKNELIYEKSDPELKKSFYKRIIIISILDYISRSSIWLSFAITGVKSNEIRHCSCRRNGGLSARAVRRQNPAGGGGQQAYGRDLPSWAVRDCENRTRQSLARLRYCKSRRDGL